MEEAFEKNRHMVIAEQDGDLDKAGEAVPSLLAACERARRFPREVEGGLVRRAVQGDQWG